MKQHTPVMSAEVLWAIQDHIQYKKEVNIFDGTLWHAWHAIRIFEQFGSKIKHYVGVDIDPQMYQTAQKNLEEFFKKYKDNQKKMIIKNIWYHDIEKLSAELKIKFDILFIDIWVNLWHFKIAERGFSIKSDGNLDMRFDNTDNELHDAKYILNNYTVKQLQEILIKYGEFSEKVADKISQTIISHRAQWAISTTAQFTELLSSVGIGTKKAAIVFQCIRIEVNHEMERLTSFLKDCKRVLKKDGILIILTYHSVEDRIVKNYFRYEDNMDMVPVTKHAIKPHYKEIQQNLPSRSAKMRVYKKVN